MTLGFAVAEANDILDDWKITAAWVQLHTGHPGADGTANAATENTRKLVSLGVASGGQLTNDVAVTWTSVAATEQWTHATFWTAETSGSFRFSGTVIAEPVLVGQDATLTIGALVVRLNVAGNP
jgi:hypothetical protein